VAVIDGAADSEYAQIDDQGRYHVIFKFEERGLKDGKGSTRLRMMQPHAGNPEGMHFPRRKGTEVMVGFMGGDPHRPLIVAAVPNAVNPSPVTSANNTRNIIHTGGNTHIEFEDLDGSEWITIATPTKKTHLHLGKPYEPASHHFELKTNGSCLFNVGSNQDILVGAKLTEEVTGVVEETYRASQDSDIKGPKETTVTKGGCFETYKSTQTTLVKGDVLETYLAGQETTVSASPRKEFFTSGQTTTVNAAAVEQQFNDDHWRSVAQAASHDHIGPVTRHVTGTAMFRYPGVNRLWGPSTRKFKSLDWTVKGELNILCGTETLSHPKGTWNSMAYTGFYGLQIYAALFTLLYGGMKLQGFGAWISIQSARKAEGFGAFVNMIGALNETHGDVKEVWFKIRKHIGALSNHH
jgi:hypothetical protein